METTHRDSTRIVKEVPEPPWKPLTHEELYGTEEDNIKPNLVALHRHLLAGGKLEVEHLYKILSDTTEIMKEEENCLDLWAPFVVIGDIHGQYHDLDALLLREFKTTNEEGPTWVFLGDYVDRGQYGVEVCLLLYAYKLNFPKKVFLIRGNHECRAVTEKFNFKPECKLRYGDKAYNRFMVSFDAMPLCATLSTYGGDVHFAVHGGISPEIENLYEISSINRFREIPRFGPMCDLIWSDPLEEETAYRIKKEDLWEWWNVDYCENPSRGIGQVYGYAAIISFLDDNSLTSIIRAHEVAREGYSENWMCKKDEEDRNFPYVTTVFSAPNYCGWYGNQAAILHISKEGDFIWTKFYEVEDKPYVLPKNMNALSYSLPFVMETTAKLILMFFELMIEEGGEVEKELNDLSTSRRYMRSKILSLASVSKKLHQIHDDDETLIALRGLYGKELPSEVKDLSPKQLMTLLQEYKEIKELDKANEMHPSVPQSPQTQTEGNADFWKGESRRTGLTPRNKGMADLSPRSKQLSPSPRRRTSHNRVSNGSVPVSPSKLYESDNSKNEEKK